MRSRFEADVPRNSGDTVDSLAHVSDCSLGPLGICAPSLAAVLEIHRLELAWSCAGRADSASSARSSNQTLGGHDSHTAIASGSRVPGRAFFAEGTMRICARIGCATAVFEHWECWVWSQPTLTFFTDHVPTVSGARSRRPGGISRNRHHRC